MSIYLKCLKNNVLLDKAEKSNLLGELPEWDLDDLYPSPDSKKISEDIGWLKVECKAFASDYEGKLSSLTANNMLICIKRYEKIEMVSGRIMSYAGLRYYQKTTDETRTKFLTDNQDKITNITSDLIFFSLEINQLVEHKLNALLKTNADLRRYKPIFDRLRSMRPHQLNKELELYIHDLSTVGSSSWNRLFDETITGLEFRISEEVMGIETVLNLLTDSNRKKRELASRELARVFKKNIKIFSRIHNTLAKEKSINDKWRKMLSPQHSRHLSNHVEPEVVNALKEAVVGAYPKISHRYYEIKRNWLGLEKMQIWDRNAPLPQEDQTLINWKDATNTVLNAYSEFSPKLSRIAKNFFDKGWIDAAVKPGKAPGAFAHPTVTDVHPYIMLNYLGKPRDIMTLAHELGHGIHQVLAAEQGELLSSTPLTLAETASVFGEMLTFKKILGNTKTKKERQILLAGKIEDQINTVVRQIAFYDFECKLHEARSKGELSSDQINELWMSVQGPSLGPAFEFMDGYETFWAYIPHFVHSPFYVYAYAFGDGLVNALYSTYEAGDKNFKEKYIHMLQAGGSKHHTELLKPFGLDATDPKFWGLGLELISKMIDELEALNIE
ncbi:MAG: M3 family oligoendopeptidase [Paracoccaceae bacterium]